MALRRTATGVLSTILLVQSTAAQTVSANAEDIRTTPVALVADSVSFDEAAQTVTAEGNVEVFQGERVLTASRITYNSQTGEITAEGPIVLRDTTGSVVIANAASLDAELRNGLITGARAIVGENAGTLAAVEGQRIDGRYSVLSKVVYSTCEVCFIAPTPLWQIRASRVVHDEVERMIHYEGAIFDVMGVPVAYLPFFSHPDPTVERKSGFLAPTFRQSSEYGFGVQVPYFIDLGPSRDMTVTAFPTSNDGLVTMGEYRQAFDTGSLTFNGSLAAVTTGLDDAWQGRGHLFGSGRFDVSDSAGAALGLGEGTMAGFGLQLTSDRTYLDRYDFSGADRLESIAYIDRYAANGFFRADGTHFRSLRENEFDSKDIVALPIFEARHVSPLGDNFGSVGVTGAGALLTRPSGRDTGRLSIGADWQADTVLPIGLAIGGFAEARLDAYTVHDDAAFDNDASLRFFPQAGIEARYPLVATFLDSTHMIEPGAQLIVAPNSGNPDDIPNEDSTTVEFDDGNIFSRNRFPGYDRVETGTRLNVGLRYARIADDPFTLNASLGQVFRFTEDTAFSAGSGLSSRSSDTVASVDFGYAPFLTVTNSYRFDNDFTLQRSEIGGLLTLERFRFAAGYIFLGEDATAGALEDREEVNASVDFDLGRRWRLGASWRQDMENDEMVSIGGRVGYRNECAALELTFGQDYPNRSDGERETFVGLRVQILGQADPTQRGRAACASPALRVN